MTERRSATPARRHLWPIVLLCAWVACGTLVPRQGWDPGLGPVVPHDSFPDDCTLCHVGNDWRTLRADFEFDHAARTGVELRGAHAEVGCLLCHNDRGPVQQFAQRGCAGCHQDPHRGELGRGCVDCHDERTWRPHEMIAAHDRTRFPLVGAHVATACFRCHPGAQVGNFAGASPECVHCHGDDLLRATSPNHAGLGLVDNCQTCHRPFGWSPAQFVHPASLPLTLGHAGRRCGDCHVTPGIYNGLSTACGSSCHLDDWQRTTNPNHAAGAFSTNCLDCHTTRGWRPATFRHSFSTSGPHSVGCAECHRDPGNFRAFSCTHCHDHSQSRMADKHKEVGGYVWVSASCFQCHPQLRE